MFMAIFMNKQKTYALMIVLIVALSFTLPVQGSVEATYIKKLPYKFNVKPPSATKPSKTTSVKILNVPNGEVVKGSVKVIVEAKGVIDHVELDGVQMEPVGYGGRYFGTWTAPSSGAASINVEAKNAEDGTLASDSVGVQVVTDCLWAVSVEVDYIYGQEPNTAVLDYLVGYWAGFAVDVTYTVDDVVPYDGVITDADFWAIEDEYNDGSDKAQDGYDSDGYGYDAEYMSGEKWVLWGTWDENQYVGGYTYVVIENKDALAGNYVFIADAMIDDWESNNGMYADDGEVIVACHELGHSIGILQLRGQSEKYDPDLYSIMSTMNVENALYMEANWYYSGSYWGTKNMSYYAVP